MIPLQKKDRKIVNEYINLLRKHFAAMISQVILFGSKARGDSKPDSDIDLLIVIESQDRRLKNRIQDLCWDVMFKHNFKTFISTIVFFKKEYNQYREWHSSFLSNVAQEGVKL